MSEIDKQFKEAVIQAKNGDVYYNINRDTNRYQVPKFHFDVLKKDGFPAISTKPLYLKSVVGELIWFLKGKTSIKYLVDNNITIWNKDTYNYHVKNGGVEVGINEYAKCVRDRYYDGNTGKSYAYHWRHSNGSTDQIQNVIDLMKRDINSSRIILEAWSPSEINDCALPPCHTGFQIVAVEGGFLINWKQRSTDLFLGLPFNITSYAILGEMLGIITGHEYKGIYGSPNCVHLYENALEGADELISRDTNSKPCELAISKSARNVLKKIGSCELTLDEGLNKIEISDFSLVNYTPKKPIKVDMLGLVK